MGAKSSVRWFGVRWDESICHNKTYCCVSVSYYLPLKHLGTPMFLLLCGLLTSPLPFTFLCSKFFLKTNLPEGPAGAALDNPPPHFQKVVEIGAVATPVLHWRSRGGARPTSLAKGTAGQCPARTIRKRDGRGGSSRSCMLWPAGLFG